MSGLSLRQMMVLGSTASPNSVLNRFRKLPVGGRMPYESFRLDHFESGEYQRNIEAGLSTIMYTPEEYRARRRGDASDAWARGQAIKKAIEEVEAKGKGDAG
ncbi:hypothetical protein [Bradyrhizobium liaoningense]|uniref:hypothetical protein n=1 Tax=Bradyrhizobium liaoningense TaxID=43992 RepID=UPI0004B5C416|nr:hypothetical protein [Bradyrhizobium liaoningense]